MTASLRLVGLVLVLIVAGKTAVRAGEAEKDAEQSRLRDWYRAPSTAATASTSETSGTARRTSSAQLHLEFKEQQLHLKGSKDSEDSSSHFRRGLSSSGNGDTARELIINGIDSNPTQNRYFARLSVWDDGIIRYNCGGVLISDRFVLTAAHCVWDFAEEWLREDVYGATIGYNCEDADNCGQDFGVYRATHYWFHPEWKPKRSILDLALVRLNQTVTEARWAQPDVGNHFHSLRFGYGDGLRSVGFGVLTDSKVRPTRLQELNLGFYPTERCEGIWGNLFDGVVCVYTNDAETGLYGRGLCFGDSGSPTVIRGAGRTVNDDVVVGITSFGSTPCQRKTRPDVLARVSAGIIYISNVVCYPGLSDMTPEWCGELGWVTGFVGSGGVDVDNSASEATEQYFSVMIQQANTAEEEEDEIRECYETSGTRYTSNLDTGKQGKCSKIARRKKLSKRIKGCKMDGKSNAGQVCCHTCEPFFEKTRRFLSSGPDPKSHNKSSERKQRQASYYYYTVPKDFPPQATSSPPE